MAIIPLERLWVLKLRLWLFRLQAPTNRKYCQKILGENSSERHWDLAAFAGYFWREQNREKHAKPETEINASTTC